MLKRSLIVGAALMTGAPALAGPSDTLDRELLADAGASASFQSGGTAGHDGRFFLASADGANRLNITGQAQFRYNLNTRDTTAPDEDITNGFNMNRLKLGFEGVVGGKWGYKLVAVFDRDGGATSLEDARMSYTFDNGVEFTWGQFQGPLLREQSVASKFQLAVDRSVMNSVFHQGWMQGVQLGYAAENVRFTGMVSDGLRTLNTPYYSAAESDVALTGRVDVRFGDASWKTFADFTSFREGATGGMVGAAVHWQTMGETANTTTFPPGGLAPTDMDMLTY
ncbi:MAG: porin, partial [Phycisphaerales bacterium JB054]